jgi:hypothetical protein
LHTAPSDFPTQAPLTQLPEQQSALEVQTPALPRQQVVPRQIEALHSVSEAQVSPGFRRHWRLAPQAPEQQSPALAQLVPP